MDDSGDFLRQRRNLVTLSVGLIVFILAQGHFKSAGGVLAFPVRFDNPSVIYYVLWGLLAYFLWRYWIFGGRAAHDKMRHNVLHRMINDGAYRSKVLNHYTPIVRNKAKTKSKVHENDVSEIGVQLVNITFKEVNANQRKQIQMIFEFQPNFRGERNDVQQHLLRYFGFEWWYLTKHFFKSAYHQEIFGDYVLPFLLCDIAAVMGVISAYQNAYAL